MGAFNVWETVFSNDDLGGLTIATDFDGRGACCRFPETAAAASVGGKEVRCRCSAEGPTASDVGSTTPCCCVAKTSTAAFDVGDATCCAAGGPAAIAAACASWYCAASEYKIYANSMSDTRTSEAMKVSTYSCKLGNILLELLKRASAPLDYDIEDGEDVEQRVKDRYSYDDGKD